MRISELQQEKINRIKRRGSLQGLVGHAAHVELVDGRAVVRDKLPAPIDEHGIPRVDIMLRQLLGQMTTKAYVWTGSFDVHHMATPKADYTVVSDNVGNAFRALPMLKVEVPRQMHALAHALFYVQPRPTSKSVMQHAVLENGQLRTLREIVDAGLDDATTQLLVHDALDEMVDPRVDIMPSREELAGMELRDLRRTVASLIRVRRYASKPLIHPAIRPRAALRHKVA